MLIAVGLWGVMMHRGSLEMGDMLSNLSADPMEEPLFGMDGKVHKGMMQGALYVHSQTAGVLAEAGKRFPGWPLFITGHSLGGKACPCASVPPGPQKFCPC